MAISVGTTYYSGLGTVYNKGGNVSSGYEVRLKYLLNSCNVTTNKYNVTSTLQMRNTSSNYNTYGNVNATKTVQGVSENISYLDSWDTSWRDMYTRTFELSANDEGKLTTTLTGSFYINSYAWSASNAALKSASVSVSVEFPTIPRASDVSCSSPYIGDNAIISITKKSSSFTSTLSYKIGSLTGTIATKTSETTVQFKTSSIKDEIYAQIPNDKKIQGTIYCDTYSGNTKIGDTQSTTFNLYIVESDCIPDVSMTLETVDNVSLNLIKSSDVVIKGISSVQANITRSAKNGAYIASSIFTCNDGQKVTNVANPTLNKVNGNVFKVTVTDTRGLSNTYTITKTAEDKTFVDYIPLAFSSVNLGRPETTSNTINAEIKGNYYNGSFYSNDKRNVQVGDDLSEKTLYFEFPIGLYEMINPELFSETIITTTNNEIYDYLDVSSITEKGVRILNGDNFYKYNYNTQEEIILETYTLPSNFGVVTKVDEENPIYKYIFIKTDVDANNNLKLTFRYKEKDGEWEGNIETILKDTLNVSEIAEITETPIEDLYFTLTGGLNDLEHFEGNILEEKEDWIVTEYNEDNQLIAKIYKYIPSGMTELTPTIQDNTFSFSGKLGTNFDYQKQYEFEFYAEDKLIYTSASDKPIIVTKGISIIRVGDGYVDVRGDIKQNGKILNILTYVKVE